MISKLKKMAARTLAWILGIGYIGWVMTLIALILGLPVFILWWMIKTVMSW